MIIMKVNCTVSKEDSSLEVFQNRKLGIIFRPKREEVTGKWRNFPSVRLITVELGYIVMEGSYKRVLF